MKFRDIKMKWLEKSNCIFETQQSCTNRVPYTHARARICDAMRLLLNVHNAILAVR